MSKIEQYSKEVQAFIKSSQEETQNVHNLAADLREKINTGMVGAVAAKEQLESYKQGVRNNLSAGAEYLKEAGQKAIAAELESLESGYKGVTADDVAELSLLSQMDIDRNDLDKYIDKYKDVPLALRRLKEISKEKSFAKVFPATKEEQLKAMNETMENSISRFSHIQTDELPTKINMVAEGNIKRIGYELEVYKSL